MNNHEMPASTDDLTEGLAVFRNGKLWRWSERRHTWIEAR